MAFDFPSSPTDGDVYAPPGGPVYHYGQSAWRTNAIPPPANVSNYPPTPQTYGAVGDGVTDDTAAFQAAAASGYDIYVPASSYKITDMVTIQDGRTWQGEGRTRSIIYVPNTFNLSALGVLRLGDGTGECNASLFDIGISFEQNQTETVRANLVHYPPAIYAVAAPRIQLDRIRISGAWDGIDLSGNSGGSYLGRMEIGAVNRGLYINGSLDFIHGESWHFWPFGFTAASLLVIFGDGLTVACELGRADLYNIDKIAAHQGLVKFTGTTGQLGAHWVGALQLDGNAARLIGTSVDNWVFGALYTSKSSATFGPDITISSGRVRVGQLWTGGNRTGPAVSVSGGTFVATGGFLSQIDDTQQWGVVSGGRLGLRNCDLPVPGTARAVPYIECTAGILQVKSCHVEATGGSGPLVSISTDSYHDISGNDFRAFSFVIPSPSSSTVMLGVYGPNRLPQLSFTPVVTFATPGDFAPTYAAQSGRYWHETNALRFEVRLQFNCNAYTTAAGTFQVGGFPFVTANTSFSSVTIGAENKIDFDTGYTSLIATMRATTGLVIIQQIGDNLSALDLGPANIKPSITSYIISLSGFIPTR